ncbi:MAG TPA: hemerythrin domain-containing protein [Ramlibacter sp.]
MNAAITHGSEFDHDGATAHTPVDTFSDCHAGILAGLRNFSTLPPLVDAARRAREVAVEVVKTMDNAVTEHHKEEEEELFPVVLRSSTPGEEHDRVQSLVWRLTDEHREIEDLWQRLRPDVHRIANGKAAEVRQEMVDLLVTAYRQHAQTEERFFLPLAQQILGRNGNHMAALGLSLHLRQAKVPFSYYV